MDLERRRGPVQEVGQVGNAVGDSLVKRQDPAVEGLAGIDHALGERIKLEDEVVHPEPSLHGEVYPGQDQQVGEHPGEAATV